MSAASSAGRTRVVWSETVGEGYFAWRRSRLSVKGLEVHLHERSGLPGFGALDVAAALLAESAALEGGETFLDLNCGNGLVGATAALGGAGQVLMADSHVVAVECARRTLLANEISPGSVFASSGTRSAGPVSHVDVVTIRLPRGTHLVRQLIWDGYQALRPGGRLYLAGGKREGIRPALDLLEGQFGRVNVLAYRKGFRLGVALKEDPSSPPAWDDPWLDHQAVHRFSVQVRGRQLEVCSRPGVFAWDRLDPGTARLLESVDVALGDRVLDLGCGSGLIGAFCATVARRGLVVLVDADVNAVDSARLTLAANGLANARVLLSDCGEAVREDSFDLVVTNPPFHARREAGFRVAHQFIQDAWSLLRPGGRLVLVANRFILYEAQIEGLFGNVEEVSGDSKYKVLRAVRV